MLEIEDRVNHPDELNKTKSRLKTKPFNDFPEFAGNKFMGVDEK
jgi:hypothetical protein